MGCVWSGPHTKSPRTRKSRAGTRSPACVHGCVRVSGHSCLHVCTNVSARVRVHRVCVFIRVCTSPYVCAGPSPHTRLSLSRVNPGKGKAKAKKKSWCAPDTADISKVSDSSRLGIPQQGDAPAPTGPRPSGPPACGLFCTGWEQPCSPEREVCASGRPAAAAPDGCSGEGQGASSWSINLPRCCPTWLTSWER